MTINFGPHIAATPAEKRLYQYMDSMDLTYRVRITDQWSSTINFEEGRSLDIFCTANYFPRETIFSCGYSSEGLYRKDQMPHGLPFLKSKISEIRYGDIDGDRDIDVAVKATNGAIYVFHNLKVNR